MIYAHVFRQATSLQRSLPDSPLRGLYGALPYLRSMTCLNTCIHWKPEDPCLMNIRC